MCPHKLFTKLKMLFDGILYGPNPIIWLWLFITKRNTLILCLYWKMNITLTQKSNKPIVIRTVGSKALAQRMQN
jgi:hypothetical protein